MLSINNYVCMLPVSNFYFIKLRIMLLINMIFRQLCTVHSFQIVQIKMIVIKYKHRNMYVLELYNMNNDF